MPLKNPNAGPDWTAAYQVSPLPWVTSSNVTGIKVHRFGSTELSGSDPYNEFVTRWLIVRNDSATALHVAFTGRGLTTSSNYFSLSQDESFSAELRVKEVHLSGANNNYQIVAGLTSVHERHMGTLTGSNGHPGVG